jgi:hypothetical protein
MKFIDIISEEGNNKLPEITEKHIDKLKKIHAVLKTGTVHYKISGDTYLYELSSNYTPKWDGYYGTIAFFYDPNERPYGIQIYKMVDGKKIPLFDQLTLTDINAIFYGGRWIDTTQNGNMFHSVLNKIRERLRAFDVALYGLR